MIKKLYFGIGLVVIIAATSSYAFAADSSPVPTWIKEVAGFWASDQISDQDFVNSLTFLIDSEIVKVPKMESLSEENQLLKQENLELKQKLMVTELENMSQFSVKPPILKIIQVSTDKNSYTAGETITIFGEVGEDRLGENVSLRILGPNGNNIVTSELVIDEEKKFRVTISTNEAGWDSSGTYTINVKLPEGIIAQTSLEFVVK